MTFIPKSFSPLTELAALDLTDMDGNDDHVREEASYRQILSAYKVEWTDNGGGTNLRLHIDGSPIGTELSGTSEVSQADIELSAVTVGLHVLTVQRGTKVAMRVRFVRTPDMDYMTWWVKLLPTTGGPLLYNHSISDITVIGHRDPKSWT